MLISESIQKPHKKAILTHCLFDEGNGEEGDNPDQSCSSQESNKRLKLGENEGNDSSKSI